MRLAYVLAVTCGCLSVLAVQSVSAEVLTGAARRAYEKTTSDGHFFTSCGKDADYFVFWAGDTPSAIEVDGKQQPVHFETHKVGDALKQPFRCNTAEGPLTITTGLTHSISNVQCGAGNWFTAKFSVAHLGSYSDDFIVDGCGGSYGRLIKGKHVLFCKLPIEDTSGVGHCAEADDGPGPRQLR